MARARLAMLREAETKSKTKQGPWSRWTTGWKANVVTTAGTIAGLSLATLGVLLAVDACTLDFASSRSLTVAVLLTVGVVATWASLRPKGHLGRWLAVAVVVTAAGLIVFLRGPGTPSPQPQWVCAVSHLALGLPPAAVVIVLLRGMAPSRLRSLVAGLAAGTTGAVVGEFGCAQSASHVATFHLGAWALVAVAVFIISSKLTPRSYAP
jgi:hypothetical protein